MCEARQRFSPSRIALGLFSPAGTCRSVFQHFGDERLPKLFASLRKSSVGEHCLGRLKAVAALCQSPRMAKHAGDLLMPPRIAGTPHQLPLLRPFRAHRRLFTRLSFSLVLITLVRGVIEQRE